MNSKTEKMPVIGRITKGIHAWAGKIAVVCFVLVLASASYAADLVIGNFETGLDGWMNRDGSTGDFGTSTTHGVTLDTHSLTVVVGPADNFWKLQHDGQLNLIGASSVSMDVTFVASEWPADAWLAFSKIAFQDHTVWNWQEVQSSSMTVTKISGADPPALDGSGNLAWVPSMGDTTWNISWPLASIGKANTVYSFLIALLQTEIAKSSAGHVYIDNIRIKYGPAVTTTVIGDWENPDSNDGWVPGWDGAVLVPGNTNGVTRGSGSLSVTTNGGYWCLQRNGLLDLTDATLKFDLTMLASEWPSQPWTKVADKILIYSNGVSGWKEYNNLAKATNISDGSATGLDWGAWAGDAQKTYSLDVSDYDARGATWMQIVITIQGGNGAGHFYFDNARLVKPEPIPPPTRLHVEGNKIKNTDGTVVVLRGVSLIDLGFLEEWEGGAINMVNRLTKENDPCGNSPGWYTKIIRIPSAPTDSNTTRWPHRFNTNNLSDPNNDTLYILLRSVVDRCAAKGVYAVIDWHGIADTHGMVADTNAFWTYMAPKFADDDHVIFELFNEPINDIGTDAQNWASVKADMQTWINTVRSYAPHTLLFVGTARWCQIIGPTANNPVDDPNVVYVTHIYPWHWLNENQYYRETIAAAAAVHPVILGEWGFTTSDPAFNGTISNYGLPLQDFVEALGISNMAWVASYDWGPPMFTDGLNYKLRIGEGEMGGFAKDWLYGTRDVGQPSYLTFNRCKVTTDSFDASATFTVPPSDFAGVNKMGVEIISLTDGKTIYSENCDLSWDLQNNRFIWSYKIPKGGAGRITLLIIDFRNKTVVIQASKINLTGLGCPLRLKITLGDFVFSGDADETIVNGKDPIPLSLMGAYKNTLAVSKISVRNSTKPLKDSFSAKGSITVGDINGSNLANSALVITWADGNGASVQTFTIPAHSFKAPKKKHSYKCTNIRATEAGGGKVSANINMDKCTFTLSVKNTTLSPTSGDVRFGLAFATFDETADYRVPRK